MGSDPATSHRRAGDPVGPCVHLCCSRRGMLLWVLFPGRSISDEGLLRALPVQAPPREKAAEEEAEGSVLRQRPAVARIEGNGKEPPAILPHNSVGGQQERTGAAQVRGRCPQHRGPAMRVRAMQEEQGEGEEEMYKEKEMLLMG